MNKNRPTNYNITQFYSSVKREPQNGLLCALTFETYKPFFQLSQFCFDRYQNRPPRNLQEKERQRKKPSQQHKA